MHKHKYIPVSLSQFLSLFIIEFVFMFCISHIHSYYIHPYIYINTTTYSHIVYSIRYQSTHTRTPLEQSTHTHIELQYIWLMKVQFSIYIPFFYNHDIANKANTNQDVIIQSTILQFHLVTLHPTPRSPYDFSLLHLKITIRS